MATAVLIAPVAVHAAEVLDVAPQAFALGHRQHGRGREGEGPAGQIDHARTASVEGLHLL